jgi:hypothetical protein
MYDVKQVEIGKKLISKPFGHTGFKHIDHFMHHDNHLIRFIIRIRFLSMSAPGSALACFLPGLCSIEKLKLDRVSNQRIIMPDGGSMPSIYWSD